MLAHHFVAVVAIGSVAEMIEVLMEVSSTDISSRVEVVDNVTSLLLDCQLKTDFLVRRLRTIEPDAQEANI